MVLFKAEYTFLITSVLWLLEIVVNVWVIQRVTCKCIRNQSLTWSLNIYNSQLIIIIYIYNSQFIHGTAD